MIPKSENHKTFPDAIFYGVRFDVTQKSDICSDNDFQEDIKNIFNKIDWGKFQLELDNQKINQQCLDLNQILSVHGYFLRVYELKNKFRELRLKESSQQKIIRQLSGCIQEKFDEFNIICVEYNKKLRKKFKPINVIYKPVKKPERKVLCYNTKDISKAYRSSWSQGEKDKEKIVHGFAYECYYCGTFLLDQTNIKGTWKFAQAYPVLCIISIIKTLLLLRKI